MWRTGSQTGGLQPSSSLRGSESRVTSLRTRKFRANLHLRVTSRGKERTERSLLCGPTAHTVRRAFLSRTGLGEPPCARSPRRLLWAEARGVGVRTGRREGGRGPSPEPTTRAAMAALFPLPARTARGGPAPQACSACAGRWGRSQAASDWRRETSIGRGGPRPSGEWRAAAQSSWSVGSRAAEGSGRWVSRSAPGDSSVLEVFSLVLSLAPGGLARPEGAHQIRRPRGSQHRKSALLVGAGAAQAGCLRLKTQALEGVRVAF